MGWVMNLEVLAKFFFVLPVRILLSVDREVFATRTHYYPQCSADSDTDQSALNRVIAG